MKSFLEKIGDRVLAVNNKTRDESEITRNKDAIVSMVETVIEDNRIKNRPIAFTNDTMKTATELRKQVVSVVERESCHPSLVNAVIEAVISSSQLETIAEKEFVEKVINILCKSEQCEQDGTNLVFKNDDEVTTTPVVDCVRHIKMIYAEMQSNIGPFHKMLGTILNYSIVPLTAVAAATAIGGIGLMEAMLDLPAVIAYSVIAYMER